MAAANSLFSGSSLDSIINNSLSTAAGVYGSQNAAEDITQANTAGIKTQQQTLGNINQLFGQQTQQGNAAFQKLGSALGLNGNAPDPSTFYNQPGYKFAVDQGTRAVNTGAAANGSAYTPNTLANIGQFVAGTASQNYNNYIQQLLSTANFGASANNTLAGANLTTGNNISTMQLNKGNAQASGVGAGSSLLQQLLGGGGVNASGLIQNGIGLLGKLFKGGGSGGSGAPSSGSGSGGIDYGSINDQLGGNGFLGTDLGSNFFDSEYNNANGIPNTQPGFDAIGTDLNQWDPAQMFGNDVQQYGNFDSFMNGDGSNFL